jgi:hypothetical protein
MILFTELFSHNLYYLLFITTFLGQYLMKFKCFNSTSFHHMYREINGKSDGLSKAGLQLENGQWHIQELKDSQHSAYFHPTLF